MTHLANTPSSAAPCCAAASASARSRCSPAATSAIPTPCNPPCTPSPAGTTGCRRRCSAPTRLARTFAESDIAPQFRFNAYYQADRAPIIDPATYRLTLAGQIADKTPWTVAQLLALPRQSQITRHVCVEGWSYIGQWSGIPLGDFLRHVGADTNARYVGFQCADGYYEGIDMPTALHPQTIMAVTARAQTLPYKFGFPLKIRIPTKLGFKNPKWVTTIYVTNQQPTGFWSDRGYNWFSGI